MSSRALRIALRADASAAIGVGHVRRCLSLASELRRAGAAVRLVSRELGVEVRHLAAQLDIEHIVLPPPAPGVIVDDLVPHAAWAGVDWRSDAQQSVEALRRWRPDWVMVDHYGFDSRWHVLVAEQLHAKVGVVDDLADRDLAAALLVDHNFHENHRDKYGDHVRDNTAVLGGPRFALLGAAYAGSNRFRVRESVDSIGIFMGGVDSGDFSSLVLLACRDKAGFAGTIEIVVTRAYAHLERLKRLAARWPDTVITRDLPDLATFFARHDLQIGAGGGATWERCCTGVPTLLLTVAKNQQAVLPALARACAAHVLDPVRSADAAEIGQAVCSLRDDNARRRELSGRAQLLVDGLGARRVSLWLSSSRLAVRPAAAADSETMYRWRNHPTTRAMSLDSSEIKWPDHERWMARVLADSSRCLLVAHIGEIDVGVIRFDAGPHDRFDVSLYLDPALHGLGIGAAMLRAGELYAAARHPFLVEYAAVVLDGNMASQRLFQSNGYDWRDGMWRKKADCKPAIEVSRK